MNTYFVIPPESKFDYISALSVLSKAGYSCAMNHSKKMVYPDPKKAKGFYPVVGIAVMDKDMFYRFCKEFRIIQRFEDDSWFSNLEPKGYTDLLALLKELQCKKPQSSSHSSEELGLFS